MFDPNRLSCAFFILCLIPTRGFAENDLASRTISVDIVDNKDSTKTTPGRCVLRMEGGQVVSPPPIRDSRNTTPGILAGNFERYCENSVDEQTANTRSNSPTPPETPLAKESPIASVADPATPLAKTPEEAVASPPTTAPPLTENGQEGRGTTPPAFTGVQTVSPLGSPSGGSAQAPSSSGARDVSGASLSGVIVPPSFTTPVEAIGLESSGTAHKATLADGGNEALSVISPTIENGSALSSDPFASNASLPATRAAAASMSSLSVSNSLARNGDATPADRIAYSAPVYAANQSSTSPTDGSSLETKSVEGQKVSGSLAALEKVVIPAPRTASDTPSIASLMIDRSRPSKFGFFDIKFPKPSSKLAESSAKAGGMRLMLRDLLRRSASFLSGEPRPNKTHQAGVGISDVENLFQLPKSAKAYLSQLSNGSEESEMELDRLTNLSMVGLVGWIPVSFFLIFLIWRKKRVKNEPLKSVAIALFMLFTSTSHAKVSVGATEVSIGTASQMGSSENYSGGEIFEGVLGAAREKIREAAEHVGARVDSSQLCSLQECLRTSSKAFCSPLEGLSQKQYEECANFLTAHSRAFATLSDANQTPFQISALPLVVQGKAGAVRNVSALTKPGDGQPVVFHLGTLQHAEEKNLLALLAHELGHKLPGSYPEDFLDRIGVAMAVYSSTHATPSQEPPELAITVDKKAFCEIASMENALLVGLLADAEGVAPSQTTLKAMETKLATKEILARGVFGSVEARYLRIVEAFRKSLSRSPSRLESELFRRRAAEKVSDLALLSSIIAHPDYLKAHEISADQFVSTAFRDFFGRHPSAREVKEAESVLAHLGRASLVNHWLTKPDEPLKRLIVDEYRRLLNRAPSEKETSENVNRIAEGGDWESLPAQIASTNEYALLQVKRAKHCSMITLSAQTE